MDDGVAAMLQTLNDAFPAVERMSAAAARAAVEARRAVVSNIDDVATAEDRLIDTKAGCHRRAGLSTARARRRASPGRGVLPWRRIRVVRHRQSRRVLSGDVAPHRLRRRIGRLPARARASGPGRSGGRVRGVRLGHRHAAELGVDPLRIAVAGDSAGGNLAAVTAILCRERGTAMPVAQVLLYPVIDPSCDTASQRRRATGYFTTRAALQWYWQQYLGGTDLPDPAYLVAPALAESLAGLPPAVVVTATLTRCTARAPPMPDSCVPHGVPVVHRDFRGLFHGFLTMLPLPAAVAARDLLWSDSG